MKGGKGYNTHRHVYKPLLGSSYTVACVIDGCKSTIGTGLETQTRGKHARQY